MNKKLMYDLLDIIIKTELEVAIKYEFGIIYEQKKEIFC